MVKEGSDWEDEMRGMVRGMLWKRRNPGPFPLDAVNGAEWAYLRSMRVRTLYDVYRAEGLYGVLQRSIGKPLRAIVLTRQQADAIDAWLPRDCSLTIAVDMGKVAEEGFLEPVYFEGPDWYTAGYVASAALQVAAVRGRRRVQATGRGNKRTLYFMRRNGRPGAGGL